MAYRLKDRNQQIPGGLKFFIAETKFSPFPYSSFKTIVNAVIQHRRANPYLTKKHGWSIDYNEVCAEVDRYNAAICVAHGWTQYVVEDASTAAPKAKARPQPSRSVKNAAVGSDLLKDWLGAGGVPVPDDIAAKRAWTCAAGAPGGQRCPHNTQGNWTRFFTVPASEMIRGMLSLRSDKALTTPSDDALGVCSVCDCPLKLKVHTPLEHIKAHTSDEVRAAFPDWCWIKAELSIST
jgi:hypothetical protein